MATEKKVYPPSMHTNIVSLLNTLKTKHDTNDLTLVMLQMDCQECKVSLDPATLPYTSK